MRLLGRLGTQVIIGAGAKIIRRVTRDIEMKNKGRKLGAEAVFRLWRSGLTYEEARRKLASTLKKQP